MCTAISVHESVGAKDLVDGRDENLGGQGKVSLCEVMEKTTADQDPSMPKWDQSTLQYPSIAVTSILVIFVNLFNKARDENARNAEAEKRKLEKEALKRKSSCFNEGPSNISFFIPEIC